MPRPRKYRNVCALPDNKTYGPMNSEATDQCVVKMTLDEYEAIRLIDYEGLNQEECAKQMNVARTTAQRIYNNARKKLSKSLIEGCIISIEGGDYTLCEEREGPGRCRRCRRRAQKNPLNLEEDQK